MSRVIYKNSQVTVQEDKCIIDSNLLMEQKMQAHLEQMEALAAQEGLEGEEGAGDESGEPEFFEGLSADQLEALTGEGTGGAVIKAQAPEPELPDPEEVLQQAIEEANARAAELLDEARAEAEQIRLAAREEGYAEGLQHAQAEEEQMRAGYEEQARALQAEYEQILGQLEPIMVERLTGIYEQIFRTELAGYSDILLGLLDKTLRGIEGAGSFLVRLSTTDYARLEEEDKMHLVAAVAGRGNLDVVEDTSLATGSALIETDMGTYDCGVDTQLELLTNRLRLLSYE